MIDSQGERQLRDVLLSLGEYRGDVTVIGGWVPYLYQRYGGFDDWKTNIARTTEVDIVVPSPLKRRGRKPLAEILTAQGFVPHANTLGAVWTKQPGDEKIELFTQHTGTALQIGMPKSILDQPSLSGLALTRLSLLVEHTIELKLESIRGADPVAVRVPTLGAYILNKTLTFNDRLTAADGGHFSAAKDVVYLRDIMVGGESVRTRVIGDLQDLNSNALLTAELQNAKRVIAETLKRPGTILPIAVAQIGEREGTTIRAATAELRGNLEVLQECFDLAIAGQDRKKGR